MIDLQGIPFYANREDDQSCMLSCLRSALEYFEKRPYSWEELEQLTGWQSGKAAWTVKAWTDLAEQGFDIQMIENFNYREYASEGKEYLQTFLKPEELEWQLKNTNLLEITPLLPKFLTTVNHIQKSPERGDIDRLLGEGYLVTVQLNSRVLNDRPGYVAHMILVLQQDGEDYIAHDPGLPGQALRRLSCSKVYEAMGATANTSEVTGLRPRGNA